MRKRQGRLKEANLSRAALYKADLSGADLEEANLFQANLKGVLGWTSLQLQQAVTLANATMPDGSKYEEWIEKENE